MQTMPLTMHWRDVALRLALTVLSSLLIGYNRREHGKAAGMRTTILVGLAAAAAMIQANLLLPMTGKTPQSFAVMDMMRLPLGILTGVGFIGGGAILKRGQVVAGVTTAATMWAVTVIGLCFGGGQLGLGCVSTLIALGTLWGVGWAELHFRSERRSKLLIEAQASGIEEDDIRNALLGAGARVVGSRLCADRREGRRAFEFHILELRRPTDTRTPPFVLALGEKPGVLKVRWESMA